MPDLVNIECASRSVGLNKYTLYKLAGEGKAPCYRAGKAIRFDVEELRAWMKKQAHPEQEEVNCSKTIISDGDGL